jgi:phage protein D
MTTSMQWRTPIPRILANGCILPGLVDVEVAANNHFCANKFNATLALDRVGSYNDIFWASVSDIQIEIQISLDADNFTSLITGAVDAVVMDPIKRVLHISGRDLSARLIEGRTQGTFSNQTSSDIATFFAERHGLTPNVTPTTTLVGRYYQSEHDRIALDQFSRSTTDWDLLVFLARQERFGLSVASTTLNFGPVVPQSATPYTICPMDCISIGLERCLTLTRAIEVTVKSWNTYQKNAFVQTVRSTTQVATERDEPSPPLQYVYVRPNLTPDQALKFAQDKLMELTLHERAVEVLLPGDLTLFPDTMLALTGTGTAFDQLYYIDTIERRLSPDSGFTQFVRAKSSSPRTVTAI